MITGRQAYFYSMLQVRGYKKTFGSALVLDVPDMPLAPGVYWLRGENGSGKSTFLNSAAGLIPFDGDIVCDETSIKKSRRLYTSIVNHAGAEPTYPRFLTGNDLLKFYKEVKGGNDQLVSKIIDSFGMKSYLTNKVDSYSSGMTKKLSLLLAFTGQPKLILLDEPFTTLDVEAAAFLNELIAGQFSTGVSFIISSHQAITMPHVSLLVRNKTIVKQ